MWCKDEGIPIKMFANFLTTLKSDVPASIVVFLVALPLSMGIAIASGAPPAAGLMTAIVGGIVVGMFQGGPLQVSGPAAGLSVIVYDLIQEFGLAQLGIIVMLAGFFQILAGALQIGQWFRAVSPAVIQGMLAGIGVLILASQFHVMVGDVPKESGLENLLAIPHAIGKGLVPEEALTMHWVAARIGILTIVAMMFWQTLAPKRLRNIIPAPLVGVSLATGEAWLQDLDIRYVVVGSDFFNAMSFPDLSDLAHLLDISILASALAMAFIASAETLLCATAVDQMHSGQRTQYNREMTAQGIGNTLCGMIGALPMTAVIVRSSTNVESGGRTRASAILHGVWMLLIVALFPALLGFIPIASLAAVLVFIGYKLVNIQTIRELHKYGRGEVIVYFVTLVTIVLTNLLTGVIAGFILALAKMLYTTHSLDVRVTTADDKKRVAIELRGVATFISLPKLASAFEGIRPGMEIDIHFENLYFIDHACLNFLGGWRKLYEKQEGKVHVDWESLQARFSRPEIPGKE